MMRTPALNEIKKSLLSMEPSELTALCLRLSKFKKDNKELLTYLLYDSADEAQFIEDVKHDMDQQFEEIRHLGAYQLTKKVRKILRLITKHAKYSGQTVTEIELLIHYSNKLHESIEDGNNLIVLNNIYQRQIEKIEKSMGKLHEDLRYDYNKPLEDLKSFQHSGY
jgi:hypothetical protein